MVIRDRLENLLVYLQGRFVRCVLDIYRCKRDTRRICWEEMEEASSSSFLLARRMKWDERDRLEVGGWR